MNDHSREDRVKEIKALVDSGQYRVDSTHIADAMLSHVNPVDSKHFVYGPEYGLNYLYAADDSTPADEPQPRTGTLVRNGRRLLIVIGVAAVVTAVIKYFA